jgi:hypothetical protein
MLAGSFVSGPVVRQYIGEEGHDRLQFLTLCPGRREKKNKGARDKIQLSRAHLQWSASLNRPQPLIFYL